MKGRQPKSDWLDSVPRRHHSEAIRRLVELGLRSEAQAASLSPRSARLWAMLTVRKRSPSANNSLTWDVSSVRHPQTNPEPLLVYCADCRCSHSIAVSADHLPDDVWLSDIEARFGLAGLRGKTRCGGASESRVCSACCREGDCCGDGASSCKLTLYVCERDANAY